MTSARNVRRKRTHSMLNTNYQWVDESINQFDEDSTNEKAPAATTKTTYESKFDEAERQLDAHLSHAGIDRNTNRFTMHVKVGTNKLRLIFTGNTQSLNGYFKAIFAGKENNIGDITTPTYTAEDWSFAWIAGEEAKLEMWFPMGELTDDSILALRAAVTGGLGVLDAEQEEALELPTISMATFVMPHTYFDIDIRDNLTYSDVVNCCNGFISFCSNLRNEHEPDRVFQDRINRGASNTIPSPRHDLGLNAVGVGAQHFSLFSQLSSDPSSSGHSFPAAQPLHSMFMLPPPSRPTAPTGPSASTKPTQMSPSQSPRP